MKSDRKAMLCIRDSKMSKEYTTDISLIKTLSLYWTCQVCTALTDTNYSSAYSCLKADNNCVHLEMLLAVGEGGRWAVQACPLHACSCVWKPNSEPSPDV